MARILVPEDERDLALFCHRAVTSEGHEVTLVANGAEALRALSQAAFDLVIANIRMPMLDGIALSLKMKHDYPGMGMILMTGFPEKRARRPAWRSRRPYSRQAVHQVRTFGRTQPRVEVTDGARRTRARLLDNTDRVVFDRSAHILDAG